jgi:hypothetical protein
MGLSPIQDFHSFERQGIFKDNGKIVIFLAREEPY